MWRTVAFLTAGGLGGALAMLLVLWRIMRRRLRVLERQILQLSRYRDVLRLLHPEKEEPEPPKPPRFKVIKGGAATVAGGAVATMRLVKEHPSQAATVGALVAFVIAIGLGVQGGEGPRPYQPPNAAPTKVVPASPPVSRNPSTVRPSRQPGPRPTGSPSPSSVPQIPPAGSIPSTVPTSRPTEPGPTSNPSPTHTAPPTPSPVQTPPTTTPPAAPPPTKRPGLCLNLNVLVNIHLCLVRPRS